VLCSSCNKDFEKLVSLNPKLCKGCYYKSYENNDICIICGKFKKISKRDKFGNPICPICASKDNIGVCDVCKRQDIMVHKNRKSDLVLCDACRKTPKSICESCSKLKNIVEGTVMCRACINSLKDKREVCYICGDLKEVHKRIEGKPLCPKCSKIGYNPPKEICIKCDKLKRINQRTDDGYAICGTCYESPKNFCVRCGDFAPIVKREGTSGFCQKCYIRPKNICSSCGELKIIEKNIDEIRLCKKCFSSFRRNRFNL
jgi:hypothetical protein